MRLWRRVSKAEVFRPTAEEWQLIRESRLRNKKWTEGKIRWAEHFEELAYKALISPVPKEESKNIDWSNRQHVIEYHKAKDRNLASKLLRELEFTIVAKSHAQERKWLRSKGLTADDFASVFREEVFRFVEAKVGDWPNGDYYIIETLELAWKRRAVDLVESESSNQRNWERSMEQIDDLGKEHPDQITNVEREAILRSMLDDPSLTEEERRLLKLAYEDPKASNPQLAALLGYKHTETVRRMKERIREKLAG